MWNLDRFTVYKRIRNSLKRSDVQASLILALSKRFYWHARWSLIHRSWMISMVNGMKILAPMGGAGALIYYQGVSEPETAEVIKYFLKPGMIFVDIGAHIGEYTLMGSKLVGENGHVYAFEPNPEIFNLLSKSIHLNNLNNISARQEAVSNENGDAEFEVCAEPSVSSLQTKKFSPRRRLLRTYKVKTVMLDSLLLDGSRKVDLIKVDVEGAELLVFQGAKNLLALSAEEAPVWIFECEPHNFENFGYRTSDLFNCLIESGYQVFRYTGSGGIQKIEAESASSVNLEGLNLIAAKDEQLLKAEMGK